MSYSDLNSYALRQLANCSIARSGLAINAGAAATVKTANALVFVIGGVIYGASALAARALTLPPESASFSPLKFYTVPKNTTSYILFVSNAAGTVYAIQSQHQGRDLAFLGRPDKGDGTVPETPEGFAPIGLIKAVTNGATTFLPGTDALDKAGVAFTFYDLMINPLGKP